MKPRGTTEPFDRKVVGFIRKTRRSPMGEQKNIVGIMVTLLVGGEQSLFIMAACDGGINRVGTGSVNNSERDMFIGRTDTVLFKELRDRITPELLGFCGRHLADPNPQGKVCELTVGFQLEDGQELVTSWRYGSESTGPPREVGQFVIDAVQATDPWFTKQIALARGGAAT
jgi:hypothetical protein